MISKSIRTGISFLHRKPGLFLIVYGFNLVAAYVVALPLYNVIASTTATNGFGVDLAAEMDIVVWADMISTVGPVARGILIQLVWIIPVLYVGKVALSVGLVNATRDGGIRGFWPGVGYYTTRGLAIGLLFLAIALVAVPVGIAVCFFIGILTGGEAATYWLFIFFIPLVVLLVFAMLDLMHDYARITLVKEDGRIWRSFVAGVKWPFQHPASVTIYIFWYLAAFVLVLLPTFLDTSVAAATTSGIWALFFAQQIALVLRSATTVAWFGSEVQYFEHIEWAMQPTIAGQSAPEQPQPAD